MVYYVKIPLKLISQLESFEANHFFCNLVKKIKHAITLYLF